MNYIILLLFSVRLTTVKSVAIMCDIYLQSYQAPLLLSVQQYTTWKKSGKIVLTTWADNHNYIIIIPANNTSTTKYAFAAFRYDAWKFPASELLKLISAIQSMIPVGCKFSVF